MNPTYDFTGQVALVTGASSGIGLAAASAFAISGAAVVLADIDQTALDAAVAELAAAGHHVLGIRCDVTDEAQVEAMVSQTVTAFGHLDMAFNNAGIAGLSGDQDSTPGREAHIDRLHAEVRWLPCSPRCANWLRYGIQPDQPGPGLVPGRCSSKAHDREHLGCGGRRVLVSRDWSGKTLAKHKADRAAVVRQALDAAGMLAPDLERTAADVLSPDGLPRFVWTDDQPDPTTYTLMLTSVVAERQRWWTQYERAKRLVPEPVDNCSATGPPSRSAIAWSFPPNCERSKSHD